MLVCEYYQLVKIDGVYDKEFKKLRRKRMIVSESDVELNNKNLLVSGRLYIVDEKATEERNEQQAKTHAFKDAKAALKNDAALRVAEAIAGVTSKALTDTTKKAVAPEDDEIKALRIQAKEAGVKSPHLYKDAGVLKLKIQEALTAKTDAQN